VRPHFNQLRQSIFEGKPFRDADLECAFPFHLFENEEVLPVAEILHARDAVRNSVGDGEFVAALPLLARWWRNDLIDQPLRGFAQDAGWFAGGIKIDGSPL